MIPRHSTRIFHFFDPDDRNFHNHRDLCGYCLDFFKGYIPDSGGGNYDKFHHHNSIKHHIRGPGLRLHDLLPLPGTGE